MLLRPRCIVPIFPGLNPICQGTAPRAGEVNHPVYCQGKQSDPGAEAAQRLAIHPSLTRTLARLGPKHVEQDAGPSLFAATRRSKLGSVFGRISVSKTMPPSLAMPMPFFAPRSTPSGARPVVKPPSDVFRELVIRRTAAAEATAPAAAPIAAGPSRRRHRAGSAVTAAERVPNVPVSPVSIAGSHVPIAAMRRRRREIRSGRRRGGRRRRRQCGGGGPGGQLLGGRSPRACCSYAAAIDPIEPCRMIGGGAAGGCAGAGAHTGWRAPLQQQRSAAVLGFTGQSLYRLLSPLRRRRLRTRPPTRAAPSPRQPLPVSRVPPSHCCFSTAPPMRFMRAALSFSRFCLSIICLSCI